MEEAEAANALQRLWRAVERTIEDLERCKLDANRLEQRLQGAGEKKGLRSSIGEIEFCTAQLDACVMEANTRWQEIRNHLAELADHGEEVAAVKRQGRQAYEDALDECERTEGLAHNMREKLKKLEVDEITKRQQAEVERERLKKEQEERDEKLKELEKRREIVQKQKAEEEKKRKAEEAARQKVQQQQPQQPQQQQPATSSLGEASSFSSGAAAGPAVVSTNPKEKMAQDTNVYRSLSQALKSKQIVKNPETAALLNKVFTSFDGTKACCDNGVRPFHSHNSLRLQR